jgi:hypothetical protein
VRGGAASTELALLDRRREQRRCQTRLDIAPEGISARLRPRRQNRVEGGRRDFAGLTTTHGAGSCSRSDADVFTAERDDGVAHRRCRGRDRRRQPSAYLRYRDEIIPQARGRTCPDVMARTDVAYLRRGKRPRCPPVGSGAGDRQGLTDLERAIGLPAAMIIRSFAGLLLCLIAAMKPPKR